MGTILQIGDYPSIRAKLGVTTDDLPDADIDTIGLLPVAEAMITSLVTDYAAILAGGGSNKVFLQAATLNLCAALAVSKLEMQRGQAFKQGDYSESETKVDWAVLREQRMGEARQYLLSISTHILARPRLLVAGGPTSSASDWPKRIEQWQARIDPHLITWLDGSGRLQFGWENMP